MSDKPYNPLDRLQLACSVANAMLAKEVSALPPKQPFNGAGIYAIYYLGDFVAYRPISNASCEVPIYAGKAISRGSRRGGLEDPTNEPVLYRRLKEHAESIQSAENLRVEDFRCRYLVTEDLWISLGEQLLIRQYRPVWNHVVDGFGNHDPGGGRRQQKRSPWDTLHPGRGWASRLPLLAKTPQEIETDIQQAFATGKCLIHPTPETTNIRS